MRRKIFVEQRQREVELLLAQPLDQVRLVSRAQDQLRHRELRPQRLDNPRQMLTQDDVRSADADLLRGVASNLLADGVEVLEEGLDKAIKFVAGRSEHERASLKKAHAEIGLQLQ